MTTSDPRQVAIPAVVTLDRIQGFRAALAALRKALEGADGEERGHMLKELDSLVMEIV